MKNQNWQALSLWQYFMLMLSIFALILLAAQSFLDPTENQLKMLFIVDTAICALFFTDFCIQFIRAPSRTSYLKWGWLDLISSIPMIPALRVARLARVARILRILRGARSSKHIISFTLVHRARSTFSAVVLGSFVLLLFSAIAIVSVEPSLSTREAFWWCLFTLITGEYGAFYPASTEGRIITALLMTAGVAVFGTFTASVASYFLEEDQREDEQRDIAVLNEVSRLGQEICELRETIEGGNHNGKHSTENR